MTPDEALDRLHRAGWSIGETGAGRPVNPASGRPPSAGGGDGREAGDEATRAREGEGNAMIYVVFQNNTGQSDEDRLVCGPYRAADLFRGRLGVMDRFHPFELAFLDGDGWKVHDGLAEGSPAYETVLFWSRLPRGFTPKKRLLPDKPYRPKPT
jgi:hypothetical protein